MGLIGAVSAADGRLARVQLLGKCRTAAPGLFFRVDGETVDEQNKREAKATAVCRQCAVRLECLSYAVDQPEKYGVWGGMGEDERARERRRRLRRGRAGKSAA